MGDVRAQRAARRTPAVVPVSLVFVGTQTVVGYLEGVFARISAQGDQTPNCLSASSTTGPRKTPRAAKGTTQHERVKNFDMLHK